MQLEMEPGWEDNVLASVDVLFIDHLGPAIARDAKRYAPVDKGALRDGIGDRVEDHTLIVEASSVAGGADREYAAYVELGHRIAHGPRMSEVGPKVKGPQPYLRPALYQERGE